MCGFTGVPAATFALGAAVGALGTMPLQLTVVQPLLLICDCLDKLIAVWTIHGSVTNFCRAERFSCWPCAALLLAAHTCLQACMFCKPFGVMLLCANMPANVKLKALCYVAGLCSEGHSQSLSDCIGNHVWAKFVWTASGPNLVCNRTVFCWQRAINRRQKAWSIC